MKDGNLKIDGSGNFVGVYRAPTGDSVAGSGTVTMDTFGVITGTVSFDTGDTGLAYFKQDQSKTTRIGLSVTTSAMMGIWQFFDASITAMPPFPLLLFDD